MDEKIKQTAAGFVLAEFLRAAGDAENDMIFDAVGKAAEYHEEKPPLLTEQVHEADDIRRLIAHLGELLIERHSLVPEVDRSFEQFVEDQDPLQPSTKDFARLKKVVLQFEKWKRDQVNPTDAFAGIVDVISVAFLATRRAQLNTPNKPVKGKEAVELFANAWVEGFGHGVLFQKLGGTRQGEDK